MAPETEILGKAALNQGHGKTVTDKKFTITSKDADRLRELMRQEEAKLDKANPSDAELLEWEARLDDSVRNLSKKIPTTLPRPEDEMNRNWNAIQSLMASEVKVLATETAHAQTSNVVAFKPKKRKTVLPWLGIAAAAALVLIMVRQGQNENPMPMDESHIQLKGNTGSVSKANCDVDATADDVQSIQPASDGLGFTGKDQARAQITVRCYSDGFLQLRFEGPEAGTLRNIPMVSGQRQGIVRDGKMMIFPLQPGVPWVLNFFLTDRQFAADEALPQSESDVANSKDYQVLWHDQISVRVQE